MSARNQQPDDHASGRRWWRSVEELAASPEFAQRVADEFPAHATEWHDPVTRRQFLTLMAASFGLMGLTGCRPAPARKIVPFVRDPVGVVPGRALYYATAMTLGGYATGLLVKAHNGRPIKVEGNPDHPASLGATDVFAQASVLALYDPDRAQAVTAGRRPRATTDALQTLQVGLRQQKARRGAGLRILTEATTSPTLRAQLGRLLTAYPEARWHQHEPAQGAGAATGATLAFGTDVETHCQLTDADVIVALDADFLGCGPAHLRYVRDFTDRRRAQGRRGAMNRLYVVESTPTITGATADHRLGLPPHRIETFARALAARAGVAGMVAPAALSADEDRWVRAIADDLAAHHGRGVVIPGPGQPAAVHVLAHALNGRLDNTGKAVVHTDPISSAAASLAELAADLDAGKVAMLLVLGGNPVYTAPADLPLGDLIARAPLSAHLGLYEDETSLACRWHIPESHYLEAWGDARAYDGSASIQQPLIEPLYGSLSALELLASLEATGQQSGHDLVRAQWQNTWQQNGNSGHFAAFWHQALHNGLVPGTAAAPRAVRLRPDWAAALPAAARSAGPYEIVFRTDSTLHDGRFANNGWLQELPRPLTGLTWDNAALVSPATARALKLNQRPGNHGGEHGEAIVDVVELRYQGRSARLPAWIAPGQPDGVVTVQLGYGRQRAGRIGTGVGSNLYRLRSAAQPWSGSGLELTKTGEQYTLAAVQQHHRMEGRDIVRAGTLAQYEANPRFHEPKPAHRESGEGRRVPLSLYPDWPQDGNQWAMSIDLTACIGCGACVVACQAENNIPIVGKVEVTRGREMHWLRVDRYDVGDEANPTVYHQAVPCMHCEHAPCEPVCPVEATTHSPDGLNEMTYNRCVGTRYCSNNCPYKVRRFNFLEFTDRHTESLKLGRNPDVTVRSRGVMEKCTYCVQRIRAGQLEAEKDGRPIRDGEIQTACQGACPARAIVFGDRNDARSAVRALQASPLNYALLAELGTRPRTTYLAALRNPNPELAGG